MPIPRTLSLFWTSLLGELPPKILSFIEREYREPLEIQPMNFTMDRLSEVMAGDVLFPRRTVQRGLNLYSRSRPGKESYVFLLDAKKVGDIVDFWNLRALGKSVVPVPKQLQGNPQLREIVINFIKHNRRPRRYNPEWYDFALIMGARGYTLQKLKDYTATLNITRDPEDASDQPLFGFQPLHPRIWSEWARDKAGELPDDAYGDEESIEVKEKGDKASSTAAKIRL